MTIASACKMQIYSREEAEHVISLVLFACRRLFVCKMGQRIDRSVCEYHVFGWVPGVLGSGGRSREVRYLSINATSTCKPDMHLRERPGGRPVSARKGGQPVYVDWFGAMSFLMNFGT